VCDYDSRPRATCAPFVDRIGFPRAKLARPPSGHNGLSPVPVAVTLSTPADLSAGVRSLPISNEEEPIPLFATDSMKPGSREVLKVFIIIFDLAGQNYSVELRTGSGPRLITARKARRRCNADSRRIHLFVLTKGYRRSGRRIGGSDGTRTRGLQRDRQAF
jgi:hypothetical protein